jgi:TonB family protein
MRATGIALIAVVTAAALDFSPARRLDGPLPLLPSPQVVGGLEETVDLTIEANGQVGNVELLRGTKPSLNLLVKVAAAWRFRPATLDRRPVRSHVLAVALFRPPQLFDGPTLGAPTVDLAAPVDEVPYPVTTRVPRYPPRALSDAIVLVEVLVGVDGRVQDAAVLQGGTGFDEEALATAREWGFRPARRSGQLVPTYAYLVFGFRQPVT